MPKERIYDTAALFDLEVGWASLGQDVQLGIITHDGRSLADWLAGTDPGGALPSGSTPRLPQFGSLWASLDRTQINRLIRMLRKARDESFGRDE